MIKNINRLLIIALFILPAVFSLSGVAFAQSGSGERILNYKSDIKINADSSMDVIETITVRCMRQEINHGIFRDFPTKYVDDYGNRKKVKFDVHWAKKDGYNEPYEVSLLINGKRVKIGSEDITLDSGRVYTYSIKYHTDRQLGYFETHDELYWNITGNDWAFEIDKASVTVRLPDGVPMENIKLKAFTGYQGDKGKGYSSTIDNESGAIRMETTRGLIPRQGFTIVVGFPKGFAHEPTKEERTQYFIEDNFGAFVGLIGLVVVLVYYISAWYYEGRDAPKGTIIPLFEPPNDLSPAAVRYIKRMGYDNKIFAASIIDMAVKGFIKIDEIGSKYSIERLKPIASLDQLGLSLEEKFLARNLLSIYDSLTFEQSNHTEISAAIKDLYKRLVTYYEGKYFVSNKGYIIFGSVLSFLVLVAMVVSVGIYEGPDSLFPFLFGCIFGSVGIGLFLFQGIPRWRTAIVGGGSRLEALGQALFMTFFLIMFGGFGLLAMFFQGSTLLGLFITLLVGINVLFYHLMKAPTPEGRRILDKIEGFKMYLSAAEKERLNILNPPEKTPELFERFLPYALALDVEQRWSEEFADVLEKASQSGDYHPTWYAGHYHGFSTAGFASSLGSSMSSAISSSSQAPGSRSGFGGGGGSGGGGGGGGGGGW